MARISYLRKMILFFIFSMSFIIILLYPPKVPEIPNPEPLLPPSLTPSLPPEPLCNLPHVDPFAPDVLEFWLHSNAKDCNRNCTIFPMPLKVVDGFLVVINESSCPSPRSYFRMKDDLSACNYSLPRTMSCMEERGYGFDRKIDTEFMTVRCNTTDHFFTYPLRKEVLVEIQKSKIYKNRPNMNIFGIGFDSMSHANFIRNLPLTLKFLNDTTQNKGTLFEMNGYSIVGDGTTQNLGGVLTGSSEQDLYEARKSFKNSRPVDDWPWIWKNASNLGYITSFIEDEPLMGAFSVRLRGFSKPPTDHFLTNFWKGIWVRPEYLPCHTGMWDWVRQFEYLLNLIEIYPDIPKFFFMFSKISHVECLNEMSRFDKILRDYLVELSKKEGGNTLFFLFGDHGARYGNFRQTIQGKIEERLPGMFIKIPEWMSREHPEIVQNLKCNQNRLITPYDMYATLQHAIHFPKVPNFLPYQNSLFNPISHKRTCEDAKVDNHWCICRNRSTVEINQNIINGGIKLVEDINTKLDTEGEGKCEVLSLKQILRVEVFRYPSEMIQFFKSGDRDGRKPILSSNGTVEEYQVQFEVTPGGGILEGDFIIRQETQIQTKNRFSRLNAYGDLVCNPKPHLRQFCVCKNLRTS